MRDKLRGNCTAVHHQSHKDLGVVLESLLGLALRPAGLGVCSTKFATLLAASVKKANILGTRIVCNLEDWPSIYRSHDSPKQILICLPHAKLPKPRQHLVRHRGLGYD